MTDTGTSTISAFRIRLGVFLLFLWWVPFWLAQPALNALFGIESAEAQHKLLITILAIQTVLGFAGLFIAGKQVAAIVRHTPFKKTPAKVWHILRHGNADE